MLNSAEVLNDPEALALMQSKLAGMVGNLSGYYLTLPKVVRRRVKALKKLQVDHLKMEAQFHKEMHAVECKYNALYQGLMAKRSEIVNALYEPKDEECDFPSDDEEEDEGEKTGEDGDKEKKLSKDLEEKMKTDEEPDEDTKGIPEFWLTIFKNVELIAENIQDCDEPILKHLTDIKVKLVADPMRFTLEFYFSPNEFFTNTVLTKTYELKCVPDENDPFSFEGPEISKAIGCKIDWNEGKNVTITTVMKKQKHKAKGSTRTVPKEVQSDSFFNFFSPPEVPENPEEEVDETTQEILSADFEIGEIIRHRLVPRAVLYFTGEALEDDYDEDDMEDEEDYDSDEEDDEDDDDDEDGPGGEGADDKERKPRPKKRGQGKNPDECKQS